MLARMALSKVVAVVVAGVSPFELGVACEGFGVDRTDDGVPRVDFAVASVDGAAVPTSGGMSISTTHRLDIADDADLVIVPATDGPAVWPPELLDLLRRTVARGARVMSICNGAFALGEAGLLDGLAARVEAGRDVPRGAGQPERALRLRRTGADLGRISRRSGSVLAP